MNRSTPVEKSSLHVLVVDSDPDICAMTCRMLAVLRHQAVSVCTGTRAAKLLDSESFDVVLIDRNVSGVGTEEVRDSFERHLPRLGVIILCTGLGGSDARRYWEIGKHVCIPKPFTMQILEEGIAAALARART